MDTTMKKPKKADKTQLYKGSILALIGNIEATAKKHKDASKKHEFGNPYWVKESQHYVRMTNEARGLRTALTIFREIFD